MKKYTLIFLSIIALFSACGNFSSQNNRVEVKRSIGKYSFYVNGERFEVKGAGIGNYCDDAFSRLVIAGGNSVRTWSLDVAQNTLDSAAKYGLMVALGLDLGKELHGFDYTDHNVVRTQLNRIKKAVDKYKDHPNLLCWVAGNELNLVLNDDGSLKDINPYTYQALNDIIKYIKEVDGNHPVTTTFAGINKKHVEDVLFYCPQLDFISYQVFKDLENLPDQIAEIDSDLPYMITEFGATGHWEMPVTYWDREIEELSGIKAEGLKHRISVGIEADPSGKNLGAFAFFWGQKQERTPTWYSLFLNSCESTESVDELTFWWTGSYPSNRSPNLNRLTIDGETSLDNVMLKIGNEYTAEVFVTDPENDELVYKWHILAEVEEKSVGGAFEEKPGNMRFRILKKERNTMIFKPPPVDGEFRLFVYVYDGMGNAAYGNIPILVQ